MVRAEGRRLREGCVHPRGDQQLGWGSGSGSGQGQGGVRMTCARAASIREAISSVEAFVLAMAAAPAPAPAFIIIAPLPEAPPAALLA